MKPLATSYPLPLPFWHVVIINERLTQPFTHSFLLTLPTTASFTLPEWQSADKNHLSLYCTSQTNQVDGKVKHVLYTVYYVHTVYNMHEIE